MVENTRGEEIVMSTAKEEILNRVRRATETRGPRSEEYSSIPRQYRCSGELDRESRLHLFAERLRDYGSGFSACTQVALAGTIGEVLQAQGKHRLLITEDVPHDWLPEGFEFSLGSELNIANSTTPRESSRLACLESH